MLYAIFDTRKTHGHFIVPTRTLARWIVSLTRFHDYELLADYRRWYLSTDYND